MAYKTVSTQTAETLMTNLKTLNAEIKKLAKDKKQKTKVKTLEKDAKAKGKKIETLLVKIIDTVDSEFGKHGVFVEKRLKAAQLLCKKN